MSPKHSLLALCAAAAVPGFHFALSGGNAPEPTPPVHSRYEVSVTNLTRGQIFSPPVVFTHGSHMPPLWTLGSKASPELAGVAEDALNPVLINKLKSTPRVGTIVELKGKNGVILPGETAKIVIDSRGRPDRISMVGMLVISNDAFFGVDGAALPRHGSISLDSPAYDAGSEANNEQCAFIPGPPCNNPRVRATAGSEGYVHVHSGIHGVGDLKPATYDWRNGVARITVRRM